MKILYLNHICWEWIFQRPQIIALLLEKNYDVTVVNKKFVLGKKIQNKNILPKNIKNVLQLPKASIKPIQWINDILFRLQVRKYDNYDLIWICHPLLFKYVPKKYQGKIVYDCMDDHLAMASKSEYGTINNCESKLLDRASLVFASSLKIKERVEKKNNNVYLVRNGYISHKGTKFNFKFDNQQCNFKIGYFGTISSWFDFELLQKSLDEFSEIEYKLIGPVESGLEIEDNKKIEFLGAKKHDELFDIVENYDALIMPFVVNDIILAVDPVKLYEYISCGKCIISVRYPEIERFEPFVYFYDNIKEYRVLLEYLIQNKFKPKYDKKMQVEFLENNNWTKRYQIMQDAIKKTGE